MSAALLAVSRLLAWPLIALVRLYQLTLSRLFGSRCRFYPSCSSYALSSLRLNGLVIGVGQAVWRLMRCGPWTKGGFDEPRPIGRRASQETQREVERI